MNIVQAGTFDLSFLHSRSAKASNMGMFVLLSTTMTSSEGTNSVRRKPRTFAKEVRAPAQITASLVLQNVRAQVY